MKIFEHHSIYLVSLLIILLNCKEKSEEKLNILESQKLCITTILEKDSALGKIRNHACEEISLSETIQQYANSVYKLNFENCPSNFKQAFKNHVAAWIEMGKFTENHSDLRGEMHDLFDEIEKSEDSLTFKPLLKAIWDTWKTVEEVKP